MLEKAIKIATEAHAGQPREGDVAYIMHPLRVMLGMEGDINAQICAVLHDVVEDTSVTFDDLRAEGFSEEILVALDCLTKRPGEEYDDFINRILPNPLACRVKIGDLLDNMDLSRISELTDADKIRNEKYKRALDRIDEVMPCADGIKSPRLIEVNGVVEVPSQVSVDRYVDMYINFVEAHGWFFGGGHKDVTEQYADDSEEENAK